MTTEKLFLRRLVAASALLILVGLSPAIFALAADRLPNLTDTWIGNLSLAPILAHLLSLWVVVSPKLYLVRHAGIALLVLAVAYALWRHWWGNGFADYSAQSLYATQDILKAEARAIHNEVPDAVCESDMAAFAKHIATEIEREKASLAEAGEVMTESQIFDLRNQVSPGLYRWLAERNGTALCLSGGGIRSASFGLGVLQALAAHPGRAKPSGNARLDVNSEGDANRSFLAAINYLSTVSGGGYIGSWLSAWLHRCGFMRVWAELVRLPVDLKDPGAEPGAVQWLRDHSNYLTPRLGITSADTLAGIAILIRNTVLNWLIILPMLFAALLLFKIFELLILVLSTYDRGGTTPQYLFGWLAALGFTAKFVALSFRLRYRASVMKIDKLWRRQADETKVTRYGLVPLMVAALAFTMCLALASAQLDRSGAGAYKGWVAAWFAGVMKDGNFKWPDILLIGAACGTLLYAISWIASLPRVHSRGIGEFWRWTLSGTIYGIVVAAVVYFFSKTDIIEWSFYTPLEWIQKFAGRLPFDPSEQFNRHALSLMFLGVPLLLLAQLISEMVFVGLQSDEADDDREWLGRAAGLVMRAGIFWIIIVFLTCVSSDVALRVIKSPLNWLILALVYIGGMRALMFARDARTPAQGPAKDAKVKSTTAILTTVALIFAVSLVVVASAAIDWFVLGMSISNISPSLDMQSAAIGDLARALIICLAIGVIASRTINVNRFSMHALYRNRLVRTFLGASVPENERRPDRFTQFNATDNLRMHQLREKYKTNMPLTPSSRDDWRPFHIINIALNVTASEKRLSWQERKAASFTATPLHCGSSYTGYRSAAVYGAAEGISLGTAMAISGAAASPNQGYNSSPALAFLMSLFNVRLGWWLGNPGCAGEATFRHDGPKTAVKSLLSEMLGSTRDDGEYVYLSDGGHFENLGLYEVVRRRCRFVIVSDAGCDPKYSFEDLGNAIRKIQIDLGVRIRFWGLDQLKPRGPDGVASGPGPYHAIGEINYAAADSSPAEPNRSDKGIILYIKPGYHGTENSAGIRSYAAANHDFPHDDTANQWFGESQLESYRALGFEIMDQILTHGIKAAREEPRADDQVGLKDVLRALQSKAVGMQEDLPTRSV